MRTIFKIALAAALLFEAAISGFGQLTTNTRVGFSNGTGGLSGTSTFSAWAPDQAEVPVLNGVFFITARSPMCTYIASQDTVIRRGAKMYGYAIVLADGPIITDWQTGRNWSDSLVAGIGRLGAQLQRPEMANLPLVVFGHSLGTNFSRGISYDFADRILGAIHFKLGSGLVPTWASQQQVQAFQQVPYCAVNGELEGPDINQGANTILAASCRQQLLQERQNLNVPAHQVVEYNGNHNTIPARLSQLLVKFIGKCIAYRIPSGTNFLNGPATLNQLDQTQGFQGFTNTFNDFTAGNVSISPYNNATAQSQYYLFDQDYAESWRDFHIAPMTSSLSAAGPLCVGQSGVSVNLASVPAVSYGPQNVFRVQLSSVLANYESGSYYPVNVGYLKSQDPNAQIPVYIPDNVHQIGAATPIMPNANNAQGTYRYTFRVISSDPPLESHNTGFIEIAPSGSCPESELYLRFSPFASNADQVYSGITWCSGRDTSFNMTILKRSTGPAFTSNNEMIIELSDSSGSFANALEVSRKTTTLPTGSNNNTWFRDTVNVRFSAGIPSGLNYRLRVRSTDPQTNGTTAGMVVHIQNCTTVGLEQSTIGRNDIKLYPNPASEWFVIKGQSLGDGLDPVVTLHDLTGRTVTQLKGILTSDGYQFSTNNITSGSYFLNMRSGTIHTVKLLIINK